jgi:DNA-binding PadR family transcriptional regulator
MTPTQTDYIVLAYLSEGPEHGYKLIERMKRENLDSVMAFSVPNIYQSLRRLHRSGAIGLRIKKNKERPDQKVYTITDVGRAILVQALRDNSLIDQQIRFKSDVVFLIADRANADRSATRDAVNARVERLSVELEATQSAFIEAEAVAPGSSGVREIAFRHQIRFLKNEIEFYRKVIKELK